MTERTREKWAERIGEWRASGLSAEEFTVGKDYKPSTLRWADSMLQGERTARARSTAASKGPAGPRSRGKPSVSPSAAPRFVPVRMRLSVPIAADVLVEVGGARIRVTRDADLALVGAVVRALQGGGR